MYKKYNLPYYCVFIVGNGLQYYAYLNLHTSTRILGYFTSTLLQSTHQLGHENIAEHLCLQSS